MREVAHGVSERLGFRLVDEEIILRAAAGAGVEPGVVSDAERRKSFIARMVDGLGSGGDAAVYALAGAGAGTTPTSIDAELRELIRSAIEETAEAGNVVIVAHAASHALAARPDVLRVLVTGSPEIRRARVASDEKLSEKDAARAVEASDSARADYLKRFYGTKSESPTQYDLVVSTDRLSPGDAVAAVTRAAGS
jgi:Cytidylate kinase-like family